MLYYYISFLIKLIKLNCTETKKKKCSRLFHLNGISLAGTRHVRNYNEPQKDDVMTMLIG